MTDLALLTRGDGAGTVPAVRPAAAADQSVSLRVHAVTYLTESIRCFELRAPDGGALPPFAAGAHIEVAIPGGVSRSYSLINSTGPRDRYLIAVQRDPDSRGGSTYMCDVLRVGDRLDVSGPRNTFPLVEDAGSSVLIAGGIGITPILAMIERLEERGRGWRLHYAVRNRAAAPFSRAVGCARTCRARPRPPACRQRGRRGARCRGDRRG